METVSCLGDLLKRDRERCGASQVQLAETLKKSRLRPSKFRRMKDSAMRSWLAKLESDKLRREVGEGVRLWLANAIDGNVELYKTLPMHDGGRKLQPDLDVLPLIKWIIKSGKRSITFQEFSRLCEASLRCSELGVSLMDPVGKNQK